MGESDILTMVQVHQHDFQSTNRHPGMWTATDKAIALFMLVSMCNANAKPSIPFFPHPCLPLNRSLLPFLSLDHIFLSAMSIP